MKAGYNGCVAITWTQTEIDGLEAAPLAFLAVGAAWSWRGQAICLTDVETAAEAWASEAGSALGTFGRSATRGNLRGSHHGTVLLTNGAQQFTATLVLTAGDSKPTLVFENGCPARDQDFWVAEITLTDHESGEVATADETVVAFTNSVQQSDNWMSVTAPVAAPAQALK